MKSWFEIRKEQEQIVAWWNDLHVAVRVYLKAKYYKRTPYAILNLKQIKTMFKKETSWKKKK